MNSSLIADLAVVTVVAALTGLLTRRIGQPNILGYLFAGLIVGPYIPIPLFADPHRIEELAEVGVVLVMFAVGLEFRIRRFLEILPVSGLTACVQMAALSWLGFSIGSVMGWSVPASICLGATLAISSTMVVSAVLRSSPVDPDVRSHVFGVLVVQDVVAIVLIAVVTALAAGEAIDARSIGVLLGQLVGLVTVLLVAGLLILPRLVRYALAQADTDVLVVLLVGAAFGLAFGATLFGYSVALGAFVAGMSVSEAQRDHDIEMAIAPLRALFSAIFFVSIGMTVDPVVAWRTLPLAMLLCAVVIGTHLVSVTVGTVLTGSSLRRGIYSGLALGQIGELSFILTAIATLGGVVPDTTLPALVTVATVTAFTTPLLFGRAQRIVHAVDRALPDRAHQVLAAHQSFVRRARTSDVGRSLRRPAAAVLLDWSALMVLFVVRSVLLPGVDPSFGGVIQVASIVIAAPFVLGLVRSGVRLVAGIRAVSRDQIGPTPRARSVEAVALLTVILGVGLPTGALLRPLVDAPWVGAVLLGALLVALVILGFRLGSVARDDPTSGVARLAREIASQLPADQGTGADSPLRSTSGPLAGLDYHPVRVRRGGAGDGRTLAELDLRCVTGATVVAITRRDAATTLPTGHERLFADDLLAVSGSADAIARARDLLEGAAPEISDQLPTRAP